MMIDSQQDERCRRQYPRSPYWEQKIIIIIADRDSGRSVGRVDASVTTIIVLLLHFLPRRPLFI